MCFYCHITSIFPNLHVNRNASVHAANQNSDLDVFPCERISEKGKGIQKVVQAEYTAGVGYSWACSSGCRKGSHCKERWKSARVRFSLS